MIVIHVNVRDRIATSSFGAIYVSGNTIDCKVKFHFDDEWNDHTFKTARFVYDGNNYQERVFTGDEVGIPSISGTHTIEIGVYADDLIVTSPARIDVVGSILEGDPTHDEPEDDVYNQIIELLNEGLVATAAVNEDGHLIITLIDDREIDAGYVVGAQGAPGEQGEQGVPGVPGQNGQDGQDGQDGYSPTITVTSVTGGHRVTVTNESSSQYFDVMDGADGAPGQAGQNGQDGQDGQDGYSPTVTVTSIAGGHRVTITDKTGSHVFDVMDGQGGGGGGDVSSVNGQTGDVVLGAADVNALPDTTVIPTELSDLTADSTHRLVTDDEKSTWNSKQSAITDLATIRSGAASGATALQQAALTPYRTSAAQDTIDNTIQAQIDALASKSDVVDVVGTYAELQAYDTTKLLTNDVVKVLDDTTHSNQRSYFRWVISGSSGSWMYVGSETVGYTKAETDTLLNAKQGTISDLGTIRSGAALGATALQSVPSGYATETYVTNAIDAAIGDIEDALQELDAAISDV